MKHLNTFLLFFAITAFFGSIVWSLFELFNWFSGDSFDWTCLILLSMSVMSPFAYVYIYLLIHARRHLIEQSKKEKDLVRLNKKLNSERENYINELMIKGAKVNHMSDYHK